MFERIQNSHFYALATIILWSYAYVGTRLVVLDHTIGAAQLGFIRNLTAALFFVALLRIQRAALPAPRDVPVFLLAGFLGFALYMFIFTKGMETVTGGTSAILLATIPLFTAALSAFFFRERLSPLGWLALLISFSGTAILSLWHGVFSLNVGVAWTLGAAVSMSFYNILQRYLSRRAARPYTSLQITSYSFMSAVFLSLFLLPSSAEQFLAASGSIRLTAILLGIFPSALAFLAWAKAISLGKNLSSVVNYLFLVPFTALIACYFALDELPDAGALVGGAVILAGLWLFNKALHLSRAASLKNLNLVKRG